MEENEMLHLTITIVLVAWALILRLLSNADSETSLCYFLMGAVVVFSSTALFVL